MRERRSVGRSQGVSSWSGLFVTDACISMHVLFFLWCAGIVTAAGIISKEVVAL